VPSAAAGERLDRFLAGARTDLSRTRVQSLIKSGHVRVNDARARASLALRAGDVVFLEIPDAEPSVLAPEEIPLAVVYEDEYLAVVDKPAGMVVHPGAGVKRGTLVHALVHRYPGIEGVGGVRRPGLVHRLDKDTSGLLVVAKSERAYRGLVEAMAGRKVSRVYRALVWGEPTRAAGRIEGAIGRDPRHRQRMAVVSRGGKAAVTHFRVEERFGIASLLRVELETGRTHQIRVHLAWIEHPVVGDPTYGGRRKRLSAPEAQRNLAGELLGCLGRQALHAAELRFAHPITGVEIDLRSPLPGDMQGALAMLRRRGPGSPH